jgi:hypothetical protein
MRRDAQREPPVSSGDGQERSPKRAPRRRLPLGRGARLVVGDVTHLVGLGDISVSGAYLITRLELGVGEEHRLLLLLVPSLVELSLRTRVVRVVPRDHATHHPHGLAVQFLDVDPASLEHLEAFVQARRLPVK